MTDSPTVGVQLAVLKDLLPVLMRHTPADLVG
jgi:hypothetical protein